MFVSLTAAVPPTCFICVYASGVTYGNCREKDLPLFSPHGRAQLLDFRLKLALKLPLAFRTRLVGILPAVRIMAELIVLCKKRTYACLERIVLQREFGSSGTC